ncbi:MAG: hypothetical protein AAF515_15570 [Pseudomonadota bacterium]
MTTDGQCRKKGEESAASFSTVFEAELCAVRKRRSRLQKSRSENEADENESKPTKPCDDVSGSLFGIALSGGGIRSATFNLGILQALAKEGLLTKADYLSTNSGGGYIGSWLTAWIHKEDPRDKATPGIERVQDSLAASLGRPTTETPQIAWLRAFSNYLTPRVGLLSGDTWMAIATYLRNMLINLLIACSAIAFVLLMPYFLLTLSDYAEGEYLLYFFGVVGAILAAFTFLQQVKRVSHSTGHLQKAELQTRLILPLLIASIALSRFHSLEHETFTFFEILTPLVLAPLAYAGAWLLVGLAIQLSWNTTREEKTLWLVVAIASVIPAAIGSGLLFVLLDKIEIGLPLHELIYLPPAVLASYLIVAMLHLGLIGNRFGEAQRQWWSRLGGWILGYACAWLVFTGIAILSPEIDWGVQLGALLGGTWLSASILGAFVGNQQGNASSALKQLIISLAPIVFILGLLVVLTLLLDAASLLDSLWSVIGGMFGLLSVAALFSLRANINTFSLHNFYRSRLVRAYIGASDEQTRERSHPFIGFDESLDVDLKLLNPQLEYSGPIQILNTALNLVGEHSLDWQERRANSFAFTPLFSGYTSSDPDGKEISAYQKTADIGSKDQAEDMTLGLAMGISGAAVSPNMGSQSSSTLAFLLTLFNVRLGWWFGNTNNKVDYVSPLTGFRYLIRELFSLSSASSKFIYLSDGGHFENTAVYELIRRECRFILSTDCGADPDWKFADLGNLMRKARVDLGARIELDVSPLLPSERFSEAHCVVGKIHYKSGKTGYLLYIKPSLTGHEPQDVQQYALANSTFPQQTTADQFFDESQFESYRALGQYIGRTVFRNATEDNRRNLETLFVDLRRTWHASSAHVSSSFTRHAEALDRLFVSLRNDTDLHFLSKQIYPEWRSLTNHDAGPQPLKEAAGIPAAPIEQQKGFYFCNSLIQLMENVYLDLNLEWEWNHPDNAGWMNLFQHWTWSSMFTATWAISAPTYGDRFCSFVERHLDVQPARLSVKMVGTVGGIGKKALNFAEIEDLEDHVFESTYQVWTSILTTSLPGTTQKVEFTCGYAITGEEQDTECLQHLRIQSHLRRNGLALQTVIGLIKAIPSLGLPPDAQHHTSPAAATMRHIFESARRYLRRD